MILQQDILIINIRKIPKTKKDSSSGLELQLPPLVYNLAKAQKHYDFPIIEPNIFDVFQGIRNIIRIIAPLIPNSFLAILLIK